MNDIDRIYDAAIYGPDAVPMERVRLGAETVADTDSVTGQVRKEQIDTDLPETNPRRS